MALCRCSIRAPTENPRFRQHPEGVPCAVPYRKDQAGRRHGLAVDGDPRKAAVFHRDPIEFCVEPHFTPGFNHALPDGADDAPEPIGADVGFRLPKDLRRGAVGGEPLQHITAQRIVDPGGQLSVGKRTGAPFPELHVAGRIQFSAAPEVFHPHDPLFHRAAPLQHDGTKPLSRQQIRRKHPRRPESGDDHRPGQRLRPPNDPEGLRFPIKDVEIPFGSRFLLPTAPELHRHGMDHADVCGLLRLPQRGLDVIDNDHGFFLRLS